MSTACPFLNFSIEHNSCSVSKASTKTRQGAQFKLTSNHTPLVFFFFFAVLRELLANQDDQNCNHELLQAPFHLHYGRKNPAN